jgi:hypothetical protein
LAVVGESLIGVDVLDVVVVGDNTTVGDDDCGTVQSMETN